MADKMVDQMVLILLILIGTCAQFALSEDCLDGYTKICILKNYEKLTPDPKGKLPLIVNISLTLTVIIIIEI